MGCITKNQLGKPQRKKAKVELPECGMDAYCWVEEMSAKDLNCLRKAHNPAKEDAFFDFEYDLLARCMCDDEGKKLFANPDELKANADLSVATIQRLAKEALNVSGINPDHPKN